jgi:inorganic pyrophosphatase
MTEYYTSNVFTPTKEVAVACNTSAASNIIYGLALGYKSVIIPIFCLAATIYVSYSLAGMYGIANAALGILSTMCVGLTIDVYGPICDNAGGLAEMTEMPGQVRECTDLLDAAGNTTAAIGKGFAIGSAALVSLALFGAFVTTVNLTSVNILQPFQFAGLLVGAMLPYWFSAMTMKSVAAAAEEMTKEVEIQFKTKPGLLQQCRLADQLANALDDLEHAREHKDTQALAAAEAKVENLRVEMAELHAQTGAPDYANCVAISTQASLREMIAPGALVMLTPIIVGFFFGVEALAGVLAGSLTSGVQVAISMSNTGGAWDNAKKYVESGQLEKDGEIVKKGSDQHCNAVIGDTVGDPMKDTSGPALNILIKLSAIISLVFAPAFFTTEQGGLLVQFFRHFTWN